MSETVKDRRTLAATETTFGQLAVGELFTVPGDEQARTFKKVDGQRGADIRGVNDEIVDHFSARDRVVRVD